MVKDYIIGGLIIAAIVVAFTISIVKTVKKARKNGLTIPIIYNTSGYETVDTIKSLEGIIDVYLPDFKYFDNDIAIKYSKANNYFN